MRSTADFIHDATEVCSRLEDDKLAALCEILAVVLVTRDISPRLGFMRCAYLLHERAAAERVSRPPIFSESCEPPPAV